MPAGASEDFLFCAVEIDSLLLLLSSFVTISPCHHDQTITIFIFVLYAKMSVAFNWLCYGQV